MLPGLGGALAATARFLPSWGRRRESLRKRKEPVSVSLPACLSHSLSNLSMSGNWPPSMGVRSCCRNHGRPVECFRDLTRLARHSIAISTSILPRGKGTLPKTRLSLRRFIAKVTLRPRNKRSREIEPKHPSYR